MIKEWVINKIALIRSAARDERGVTAVEFALVAPVFLIFSLGIVDFGRVYWVKNTMQFVVEQTARKAMVDPTMTSSELVSYATTKAKDLFADITFTASSQTIGSTQYKTISASYNFDYNIPFVNLSQAPLKAQARIPVTITNSTNGTSDNGNNGNGCNGGSGESDGGNHHSGGEDSGSHMSGDNGNDGSHMSGDNGNDGESHASDSSSDGNESSDANCNSNDNSSHDGNESEDGSSSQDGNSSQDDGGDS